MTATVTKKKATPKKPATVPSLGCGPIEIPELRVRRLRVEILGTSPIYLKNNYRGVGIFGEPGQPKPGGGKTGGTKKMGGLQEALASVRLVEPGHICHTSDAMKAALVHAIGQVKGLDRTNFSGVFHVNSVDDPGGELIRVYGKPELCSQVGKNAAQAPIPMHRIRMVEWAASFEIEYASELISQEHVINLVNLAGYISGWGDKRVAGKKVKHLRGGQWVLPTKASELKRYKDLLKLKHRVTGNIGARKVLIK